VSAMAPLINSDQTASSTTVTQQEIEDVPIGGRQVLDLVLTLPNVSGVNQPDVVSVYQNTLAPGSGTHQRQSPGRDQLPGGMASNNTAWASIAR